MLLDYGKQYAILEKALPNYRDFSKVAQRAMLAIVIALAAKDMLKEDCIPWPKVGDSIFGNLDGEETE